jgi:hypothetical protein
MLALIPVVLALVVPALGVQVTKVNPGMQMTFYGFPDNDPVGAQISNPCGSRTTAGGVGSLVDPLTMAMFPGPDRPFAMCDIVYVPYLRKYLRLEDDCMTCTIDAANTIGDKSWFDVWMGNSTVNQGQPLINCYDGFTQNPVNLISFTGPPDNTYPVVGKKHMTCCIR